MSVKTEKELIALAKAGDERSFELLIEQCKTKAYNIALRYLRNEEDAMDALQESFIKIYRHLESFREGSKFDTWVYRIVVNTCNDMLRKNHGAPVEYLNRSDEEEEEYTLELPDTDPGPQESLLRKEQAKLILDALDYIWKNPETGYKEWKTHAYLEEAYAKLGYELTLAGDIPG
ncbi:MAG: sigma-70 family RNA polymerase sigma factor, partial [Firmicutes bacterium]|nr:sigma-70 family RNA polymerase sigma factor [Bacillota bacterium]